MQERTWRHGLGVAARPCMRRPSTTRIRPVVQVLLAAGAELEARDKSGRTPLHEAAQYNENPARGPGGTGRRWRHASASDG